ncbi:MAG: IPExxxVDY family protein [Bacteroidales bacterium]|jgi:hypothetical protein|nr:IPExxxVDY family protein [Bacteroidales bacterium]
MAGAPKIKRLQLEVNQESQTVLAGIASAEPDYKLSLLINKKLKISLKSSSPLVIRDERGNEAHFSRFIDRTAEHSGHSYELICNRSEKKILLGKLRNIDYIFMINNIINNTETENVLTGLRETESVTGVFSIDHRSLKDKNLQYLIQ